MALSFPCRRRSIRRLERLGRGLSPFQLLAGGQQQDFRSRCRHGSSAFARPGESLLRRRRPNCREWPTWVSSSPTAAGHRQANKRPVAVNRQQNDIRSQLRHVRNELRIADIIDIKKVKRNQESQSAVTALIALGRGRNRFDAGAVNVEAMPGAENGVVPGMTRATLSLPRMTVLSPRIFSTSTGEH